MKGKLASALKYTKHILTTGAISETSREVEIEICNRFDDNGKVFVEFGMGLGNITKEILNRMPKDAMLYSFEVKKDFCMQVQQEINDDRLIIINDGAENIRNHVKEEVDNMVSSMPFTFFSKEKTDLILGESKSILKSGGFFSQILYSKIHFKKFSAAWDACEMVEASNFPAGYIYHCSKK
jgi:phospholipid N-methyltransferase